MKFCVRHRGDDGRVVETTVEAADRAGVFAELSKRGITAISIAEGEARPARKLSQRREVAKVRTRFILCGFLVLACLACGFWWLIRGDSSTEGDEKVKQKGLTALQTPSTAGHEAKGTEATTKATASVATSATIPPDETTNEVSATESTPPKKNFRIIRRNEGKKKLFHNVADIYISRLVNTTPGSGVIGTMNYDRFQDQLLRALEQPITIDDDDTPEEVAKKQAVIQTRAELKQMLDSGEDIAQVMREAESEMRRLWNYRRSLHLELAKAQKDGKFNADDMKDYIDAANKMLTDNGMEPLKHPEFWLRRMRQEKFESSR